MKSDRLCETCNVPLKPDESDACPDCWAKAWDRDAEPLQSPPKTVRLWAWINGGFVRLKLKPDHSYHWGHSEKTDEGWSSSYESWRWETADELVLNDYGTAAMDCDGRFDSGGQRQCHVSELAAIGNPDGNRLTPNWTDPLTHQRDYEAEKAGY